jgi:hypothetical protein
MEGHRDSGRGLGKRAKPYLELQGYRSLKLATSATEPQTAIPDTAIARKQRQQHHSLAKNTDEGAHVASPDADSKARFDSLDLQCETSSFF